MKFFINSTLFLKKTKRLNDIKNFVENKIIKLGDVCFGDCNIGVVLDLNIYREILEVIVKGEK